jgi:FkbM family methyltransferase
VTLGYWSNSKLAEEIYANAFERDERRILDALVREGSTVIDIGANIGFYTCLFAAAVGPRGRVLAFEPTPVTFAALQENVRRNGFGNVEVQEVALSDRAGTATFHVFPQGADAYNSLGASTAWGTVSAEEVTVRTAPLDELLAAIPPASISVVKIDVEGAEALVLSGGSRFFERLEETVVMIELNEEAARQCGSTIREVLDRMQSLGYAAHHLTDAGQLAPIDEPALAHLMSMQARHYDAFFVKPAGAKRLASNG